MFFDTAPVPVLQYYEEVNNSIGTFGGITVFTPIQIAYSRTHGSLIVCDTTKQCSIINYTCKNESSTLYSIPE